MLATTLKNNNEIEPLDLGQITIPKTIDYELNRYYTETDRLAPLCFDFSKSRYVDIAALVNCISVLVQRSENKLKTFINLPQSKKVRDFFKVWRFPEAIEAATKTEFSSFIRNENDYDKFIKEKQTTYKEGMTGVDFLTFNPDWKKGNPSKRNFFEFSTICNRQGNSLSAQIFKESPNSERYNWDGSLIQSVLAKHVKNDPQDIARVIIFEAMSNAIWHPNAKLVQVVSQFQFNKTKKKSNKKGTFRICIWDDGESIAKTLLNGLNKYKTIRAFQLHPYMYDLVYVEVRNFGEDKLLKKELFDPGKKLKNKSESRLLLASLTPGITRKTNKHAAQEEDISNTDSMKTLFDDLSGMGLYLLHKAVIDQYKGSLIIRSGRHLLKIEKANKLCPNKARYMCKITKYPKLFNLFRGNLITIQMPVHYCEGDMK